MQIPLFKPQTEWLPPENFPDLSKYDDIAIDLETKDPDLMKMGSGSIVGNGDVVGIAVAVERAVVEQAETVGRPVRELHGLIENIPVEISLSSF